MYIKLAWGGEEEQAKERAAGNRNAKNWQDEARKVLERTMEHYWKARIEVPSTTPELPPAGSKDNDDSIASEYDHLRRSRLLPDNQDDGWEAELRRYLKDFAQDVTKDSDIVTWWQDNGHYYPTLCRVALDFLPCQASSVPCERLFSGGGEIATKRRARLGADRFEELQMMKFAWRNNIGDLTAWNSAQVEEVDEMREYEDFLLADEEQCVWDLAEDEISSF